MEKPLTASVRAEFAARALARARVDERRRADALSGSPFPGIAELHRQARDRSIREAEELGATEEQIAAALKR